MTEPIDPTPDPTTAVNHTATPLDPQQASGLISKVLAPAIQLWLRSQVDQVESLNVEIAAGNRQLLSGVIPQVKLTAQQAVYQGLHLSDVELTGEQIRINLGQVARGKALKLLQPIAIQGKVILREADLNASLQAPLLATAIKQFLAELLRSGPIDLGTDAPTLNLQNLQMRLAAERLSLRADLISVSGQATEIALRTGLRLTQPNQLQLTQTQWLPHATAKRGLALKELEGYAFDLGPDTDLQEFTIAPVAIICAGRLMVQP
jgi:LmeA-like phospholipid-binding